MDDDRRPRANRSQANRPRANRPWASRRPERQRPARQRPERRSGGGTPAPQQRAIWRCPVCAAVVPHPHRPGRARVYCTNACRQRAYRWRRQRRSELSVTPPPQRATTLDRTHALRSTADLVTPLVDERGRRVTACGTFARAAQDRPHRHHHPWFFAASSIDPVTGRSTMGFTTCRRCTELLDVPVQPLEQVLAAIGADSAARRGRLSPGGP